METRRRRYITLALLGSTLIVLLGRLFLQSRSRDPWDLSPPLKDALITDGWAQPRAYRNGTHYGADFRAAVGTPTYAVADGVVSSVDMSRSTPGGIAILVRHTNGMTAGYAHLSKVMVQRGQRVKRGDILALTGNTGPGTHAISSPHLHMTIRIEEPYLPAYVAAYGTPKSGFFERNSNGVAVPIEPLFPTRYLDSVVAEARKTGTTLYA